MPYKRPGFWVEMLILGFMLVLGMGTLNAWLPGIWGSLSRIAFAAALFGLYGLHYERRWNKGERK